MKSYVIALDQGTTSCRSIVFNRSGEIVSKAQEEFTQFYPQAGWVEHDAEEIWTVQLRTLRNAAASIPPEEIAAIGITNQRETTVLWDRATGKPVHPAIVWQCRRSDEICQTLRSRGSDFMLRNKTGLVLDPYFSGTKVKWILDQHPDIKQRAEQGDILFGTIDSWLLWNLTKGAVHATDVSNASRTLLFNIHTLDWDDEILAELNIPRCMLPEIRSSSEIYGFTDLLGKSTVIPVSGAAGDQQAALFGQSCFEKGMAKNTYGTGCFMLMNTGTQAVASANGLLTTIAWKVGDVTEYALEGSVFIAGAVVQWLRDGLGLIGNAAESEAIAASVKDTDGVYFVPAFTGLGTPYWNTQARGMIAGLTRGTSKAHLVRASLEAIAYQTRDVLELMEQESGIRLKELRVDGGAVSNRFLMQFQSDLLHAAVVSPMIQETTALGAAYLAGLAVGFWESKQEIANLWKADRTYQPEMSEEERQLKYEGWKRAVGYQLLPFG